MVQSIISVDKITKTFTVEGNRQDLTVLENININIKENEFVCIVGPSGCGKSTLLRLIAGLESATEGHVFYRGEKLIKPRKEIGMVFQNYSLMPWLNVEDNISMGLNFKRVSKSEKKKTVDEFLKIIGLEDFRKSYPHELSGGMQQRVAIARALANSPDVVLMDEPFGALDAYTRILLQKELLRIWEYDKKTIIFVTHSVDEAIYLADRIILMSRRKGSIDREIFVDIPRIRERSDLRYAKLTQELLEELEQLNDR
ncbi:ABC transporter ATP-binding protein [Alkaliphilus oremlandii]|uniref:ABC-type quaternary amine transporter n=1 Tax=Alkaliphilus oremlandii (strain OhILAs) TaxID=350688 RepID=A8ML50_ALKOO|nr:ABC transporter ATP-binding protein [Alkaliphilus oremlandii]ABW17867.1 ABC transporter related [Alkaliphilus oremlandii OhILAs]